LKDLKKKKKEYSLNSERNIWKLILEQKIDDALSVVSVNDELLRTKIEEFQVDLYRAIEDKANFLYEIASKYSHMDRKEYVDAIKNDETLNEFKFISSVMFGLHQKKKR